MRKSTPVYLVLGLVILLISCHKPKKTSYLDKVDVDDDIWSYDCNELSDYVNDYGVTDYDGNAHPGYYGWSLVEFRYSPFFYDRGFLSRAQYHCPCNNTTYQTLDECLSNCQVTLGCFTGICEPVGQTCITANKVDVRFYANIHTTVAKWDPDESLSAICLGEKFRWESDILKHEQQHYKDIESILEDLNQQWKQQQSFEGCGSTEAEADNNLQQSIQQALDNEINSLIQEAERMANEFHSRPEGRIKGINCEYCD